MYFFNYRTFWASHLVTLSLRIALFCQVQKLPNMLIMDEISDQVHRSKKCPTSVDSMLSWFGFVGPQRDHIIWGHYPPSSSPLLQQTVPANQLPLCKEVQKSLKKVAFFIAGKVLSQGCECCSCLCCWTNLLGYSWYVWLPQRPSTVGWCVTSSLSFLF